MRQSQKRGCAECGLVRVFSHPTGRFCSDRCRLRAWAKRQVGAPPPHRRTKPRTWEVVDQAAVPREYLAVVAKRIDRALASGVDVPGVRRKE